MSVSVVVLSKFPEIFEGFKESVDRDAPELHKAVVWDQRSEMQIDQAPDPWVHMFVGHPFHIARNANHGWMASPRGSDLLYAGDDTRIIEPDTIERLREVAYSDEKIGIVAARTIAPGAKYPHSEVRFKSESFVAFVFVFIKRAVINKIGYLDEVYQGYGVDDIDYCIRARQAGFLVGFANGVTVQHGVDGYPHMSTFRRVKTEKQIALEDAENWKRFAEKYGLPNDRKRIWEWIRRLQ